MATPEVKLAQSLEVLRQLQSDDFKAIRSSDISRTHRERLVKTGFLKEVLRGWYVASNPSENKGETTAWYTSYWQFISEYLEERFNDHWVLSPDQSIMFHSGNHAIPRQLLVRSPLAGNKITNLLYNTSFFEVRTILPKKPEIVEFDNLRLYSLPSALVNASPGLFDSHPTDIATALSLIKDASEILPILLEGGHSVVAGRLAGALKVLEKNRVANDIVRTMEAAGYSVRVQDPFKKETIQFNVPREKSPYVARIKNMWSVMREVIIHNFPESPGLPKDKNAFLKDVEDAYTTDAYHSLSIEGYKVTPELIEKVRSGNWNPDGDDNDNEQRNALAARGYWQAHQAVINSLKRILNGENPGNVADEDHGEWYRQLFSPGVSAGFIKPADLAGYRNGPVFIRNSMHVPLNHEAVRDTMPELFQLIEHEKNPAVKVVLGHFIFVYIHPYRDGNGRIGRFLMNSMLAAGGFPWTIIPLKSRARYMESLEAASVDQNILPFTQFLAQLVEDRLKGSPPPAIP